MSKKFKLQCVGIDATNLVWLPSFSSNEISGVEEDNYVYTTIESCNNFEIGESISHSNVDSRKLILSTSFLHKLRTVLPEYLKVIHNFSKISLLIVENSCDYDKYLEELRDIPEVENIGLGHPKSVKDIENFIRLVGDIKYITLDLCPFNFNRDIIAWCEKNSVDIIGLNPTGDELTEKVLINTFSLPYLLEFAANYCSLVFTDGSNAEYLNSLIGEDSSDRYLMQKNVSKMIKPINKCVNTFIKLEDEVILPYNINDSFIDPDELIINLGTEYDSFIKFPKDRHLEDKFASYINEKFTNLEFPEDSNDFSRLSILRNLVMNNISSFYPNNKKEDWYYYISQAGKSVFIITAYTEKVEKAGFLSKKLVQVQEHYYLYYENSRFFFAKMK